jgi:hypothetical protein
VLALRPSPAEAQAAEPAPQAPPTWAVQVDPQSRCAADADFAATLADPIPPRQRASVADAELVATVHVSRTPQALQASIQVFDRVLQSSAGARELTLPLTDCAQAADALSLVIGVLVEAGRTQPARPPEPVPPPPPPPPELPPPEPPRGEEEEEPAPPPPEPPKVPEPKRYAWLGPRAGHDLAFQAGIGGGLLPGVYGGGSFGWGIRPAHAWPIWLSATGFWPQSASDQRGRFSALYGGISVCPLTGARGRISAQVCPSFSAGALWAEGRKLLTTKDRSLAQAFVGLELRGDLRIAGPLSLALTGRLDVPLIRQNFTYRRPGGDTSPAESVTIHRVAPVTLALLAGIALHFR